MSDYSPMAIDIMVNDYLRALSSIDGALRESYKEGNKSRIFNFNPDKTLESWIYQYTQDNGYFFEYINEGKIKISFRSY